MNNNMTMSNAKITTDNLKVLKDQIEYEALLNKKARQYGEYCNDTNLKGVCNRVADVHKQNFTSLKSYLDMQQ